jgi:RND superfamily putative drug exporter
MTGAITAIGGWSTRHPWRAIVLWLAFVGAAVALLAATGSKQLQNGAVGESARGYTLLDGHPVSLDQHQYVYLHSGAFGVGDPAFRSAVGRARALLRSAIGGPTTLQVSHDGHSALVGATTTHGFDAAPLDGAVRAIGRGGLTATLEGIGSSAGSNNDLKRAEQLSIPVTLLVLLFAFGAIVAALVPVLLAATAVVAAFGLLGPISQVFPLDSSVKTVVLLIGMAVGVDYALFYVVRSREERARGLGSHEALARTARTSGRTVLVAGTTVAIAMAAQFAIGSDIFNGIASGTIAVVGCAVAGSVTVLPAVLELLGTRIDRGRIPFLPHLHTDTAKSRFWPALIDRVLRRPLVAFLLAVAFLVALAASALGLHVAKPSSDALSARSSSAAAQVAAEFPSSCEPQTCAPAIVVATTPRGKRAAVLAAAARLEQVAAAYGISHPPFATHLSDDRETVALQLPLSGLGDNGASRRAIHVLRAELIPQTLGRIAGVETAVTGDTAEDVDFTNQMKNGVPNVIGLVLGLAFLLLLVTFRSLVVPLKAITLNLLSVAASLGVLVLVFQNHWAESLLGFHSNGAVISWLPLFLFVVLFGLSMDYHVFILSRVREGVDAGLTTDEALRHGITRTAGVVTSAALVMVGVFALFGTASALDLKQAGVGLAVAVLLDATVIRGVLLPASMKLLGERNWYLPRRLEWLPRVGHEQAREDQQLPEPAAAFD